MRAAFARAGLVLEGWRADRRGRGLTARKAGGWGEGGAAVRNQRARESAHAFQQIAFQTIQSSAIVCFLHYKIQSFFDITQQNVRLESFDEMYELFDGTIFHDKIDVWGITSI